MAFSLRAGTHWCHDFPKLARESGFYFNAHRTPVRIDWNRISTIDIDRLMRERDFLTIDENVNNVVDYSLESAYDIKILDPNFVKIFRLAQLSVEYLLYCRQYLDQSVIILKDDLKLKLEENQKLKRELLATEETIKDLKEKSKEKYRFLEKKMSDSTGEIHKCPHCPKTFISSTFMTAHLSRRHSGLSLPITSPIHDEYRAQAEKLHNEIKNLKERLNETERIIRSDSSKLEHPKKLLSDEQQKVEEDYDKYREEMANLRSILFSEMQNLDTTEKKNHSEKNELVKQQENEIQRLRDQLQTQLSFQNQSRLKEETYFWQSKIQEMEHQHRKDIENLNEQLTANQQATDKLKTDYTNKIMGLEEKSRTYLATLVQKESKLREISMVEIQPKNDQISVRNSVGSEIGNVGCKRPDLKASVIYPPEALAKKDASQSFVKAEDLEKFTKEHGVSNAEIGDEIFRKPDSKILAICPKTPKKTGVEAREDPKQDDEIEVQGLVYEENVKHFDRLSSPFVKIHNLEVQSRNIVNRVAFDLESKSYRSPEVDSESPTLSESEVSAVESDLTEETFSDGDNGEGSQELGTRRIEDLRVDLQEDFDRRLRDLGIDPEWQGIPFSTYRQLVNIMAHHRSLATKKYRDFKSVRQEILHKLSTTMSKIERPTKLNHKISTKSPLNKLMTNVRTKTINGLKVLKRQGDNSTEKPKLAVREKPRIMKLQKELLPKKLDDEFRRERLSQNFSPKFSNTRYVASPQNQTKVLDCSADLKQLFHSYESIKGFKDPPSQWYPELGSSNLEFGSQKLDEIASLPSSPKNKSLLKAMTGSVNSLMKKKVLFDLADEDSGSSRSSSLAEPTPSFFGDDDSRKSENNKLPRASQSEKILEIARNIDKTLSAVRQRPVGGVNLYSNEVYGEKESSVRTSAVQEKTPQPAPRTSTLLDVSVAKDASTSNISNLDLVIEELLRMD